MSPAAQQPQALSLAPAGAVPTGVAPVVLAPVRRSPLGALVAPLAERIAGKIIAPYLVLVVLLAVLATYLVARSITSTLEARFANSLLDAGHAANEAMVKVEDEHLQALRLITNVVGIGDAVSAGNEGALEPLVLPIQVNNQLRLVDVVAADGTLLLALRGEQGPEDASGSVNTAIGRSALAQRVLAGTVDALGDKFTDVVTTTAGPVLYSAAPVRVDGVVVGAVLVGTPLEAVVARLARESQANLTLYTPDGQLLLTTLPLPGGVPVTGQAGLDVMVSRGTGEDGRQADGAAQVTLPANQAEQLLAANPLLVRRGLTLGQRPYQEMVGALELRSRPFLPLGVAVRVTAIQQAIATSSATLIGLFMVVIVGVLVLGVALARAITRPIGTLVSATERVSAGDLSREVTVTSRDEAGRLARSFNQMVAGLRERERIRETFGQYVTNQVMEAVLSGRVKVGGQRQDITVLVSDVRGFTSLSEGLEPEAVVDLLNRYFDRMADAVIEFGGTLDKFIGDGILVEFGAPLPVERHALRAVLCALRMRELLLEFNQEQRQRGLAELRIGIGIHTGTAVVGNVGAEGKKIEFTAIGDTVNVASRLESATKTLGADIVISAVTYAQVRAYVHAGAPRALHVKGRHEPVDAVTVLGLQPGISLGAALLTAPEPPDRALTPAPPALDVLDAPAGGAPSNLLRLPVLVAAPGPVAALATARPTARAAAPAAALAVYAPPPPASPVGDAALAA